MCKLNEQKHTEQMGWRGATCFNAPFPARLSASMLAFVMAPVVAIVVSVVFAAEPASCQTVQVPPSAQSVQVVQASPGKAIKRAKVRRPTHRRRSSKGSSAPTGSSAAALTSSADSATPTHSDPKLRALTPHIDLTPGQRDAADVTAVLKYGARKHAEGNYEEAEAAFRHVLSRDPSNVDAFYDLGALAERKGDLIAALSSYRAALALKPHDKEIAEAVSSIEKTLRNRPAFSFRENHHQAVSRPGAPWSGSALVPPLSSTPASASALSSFPALGSSDSSNAYDDSVLNSQVVPGAAADLPPLVVSPQVGALSVDPATIAAGTFQLSSAKNGLLAPTMGVTPASASLPSTPPVVGVAPRSHPVARMFLNTALNQGASIGLRAAGLHCPACHFMRFRF